MNTVEILALQKKWFLSGNTLDYSYRLNALKKLYNKIIDNENDILQALTFDLGKSDIEGYITEVGIVKAELKFAIKHLRVWMKKKKYKNTFLHFPARSYSIHEPFGVALIISPWNYPFLLALQPLIGAISAGNCAIIKPSEHAPHIAKILNKLILSCYDEQYCAIIQGGAEVAKELLEQKFDYIFFTGNASVGKIVMQSASKNLTPLTLELGGKSPVIVDNTANIDITAKRIVFGKLINAGQTCVAPDYVFAHSDIKQKLIEKLIFYIKQYYPKNESQEIDDYPKIINANHFNRIINLMSGQKIIYGGRANVETLKIEPTIIVDAEMDSPLMQEEIFAPLLPIIEYDDINNLVDIIKNRPKPLALYLFSKDKHMWKYITKSVSFGGGCINDCLLHVASPHLPFGGVGESGMGKYHGRASFDTFSHEKLILHKSMKLDLKVRYRPYTKKKINFLKKH